MKITVNKCPDTGELFESDSEYCRHRRRILREASIAKQKLELAAKFKIWLDNEKVNIKSPGDIPGWFLDNQTAIMDAYRHGARATRYYFGSSEEVYSTDKFTKLEFSNIRFNDSVSNTHACPDNGVTNWGGMVKGAPRGYVGWTISVAGTLSREQKNMYSYPAANLLNLVGIKTGTGGGGNTDWGYGASIFLADWPGLQAWIVEQESLKIISRLKGTL